MSPRANDAMPFEPLYYGDRLDIVNPYGDVGLITLWSPLPAARRVLQGISTEILDPAASRVAVLANLYGDGMHQMLCNLLHNPQIRHLVAVGEDLDLPTCREIETFLREGVEETEMLGTRVWRIPGTTRIFPVLPDFDAQRLQKSLTFRYLGKLAGGAAGAVLPDYLAALPRYPADEHSERLTVEIPPAMPDDYSYRPSDVTGHQIVRRKPLDCWEELVARTIRFGHPVELKNGSRIELLNTKVTVTDPGDDPEEVLTRYGFSLAAFHQYQTTMLDPSPPATGISYTYGNRIRGYFRQNENDSDALHTAVRLLRADPESRRAYISLWDTSADLQNSDQERSVSAPCLTTLFFRRSAGRLTLTATYRSHNLLTAWLQNLYGLIGIQRYVCAETGMPPGSITVLSHSLGIDPTSPRYGVAKGIADSWTRDEDIDRTTGKHTLREDPNGYFVVTIDKDAGMLVAEHRFGGMLVKQYRADRAAKIEREIIGDLAVSLVSHALWLGRELMTKEELLRKHLSRRATDTAGQR